MDESYVLIPLPGKMPLSYDIDEKRRLVLTTAWDAVTGAEALELQRQLKSDPHFNSDFSQRWIWLALHPVSTDRATITEIAARHSFSAKSRRAFVVGSKPIRVRNGAHVHRAQQSNGQGGNAAIYRPRRSAAVARPRTVRLTTR